MGAQTDGIMLGIQKLPQAKQEHLKYWLGILVQILELRRQGRGLDAQLLTLEATDKAGRG